ncbi:DNA translocase FtsK [Reticulibacter mediterranei]|nr:DNA translocase FtsK [Reticulibacter mediterranei]
MLPQDPHDNKLLTVGIILIAALIIFASTILTLANNLHIPNGQNVVAIGIAIVIVIGLLIALFHDQLLAWYQSHFGGENEGDHYALPAPGQTQASAYSSDEHYYTSPTGGGSSPDLGGPVLALARNCPLPYDSALNSTLILEKPQTRRRLSVTRLYLEQLGQFQQPMLIVTMNPSYASLLPFFTNGWLAGHAEAREDRLTLLNRYQARHTGNEKARYAILNEENASLFGARMLQVGAQVVLDCSTFDTPEQAGLVLSRLLEGLRSCDVLACIAFVEAHQWIPNGAWPGMIRDLQIATQVRTSIEQLMAEEKHAIYLTAEVLQALDLSLVRRCKLWAINTVPDMADQIFIQYYCGISELAIQRLQQVGMLVDLTTRQGMEVLFHPNKSLHEEESGGRNTSGLLFDDLSQLLPVVQEHDPKKAEAEDGQEREEGAVEGSSSARKAFSRQLMAYAVALAATGPQHFTQTALKRPPKTLLVQDNLPITFVDLAQELRLKNALSDKDLLSSERAAFLWEEVQKLSDEERAGYEQDIEGALQAIIERRRLLQEATGGTLSRWQLPSITTIFQPAPKEQTISRDEVRAMAQKIQLLLDGQRVYADVLEEYIKVGAKILSFGILPTGLPLKDGDNIARDRSGAIIYTKETRIAEITKLKKDIQARVQAKTIRMLEPIPGEACVGVEIPNPYPTTVVVRDILEDPEFQRAHLKSGLVIAIGRDLAGNVVYLDMEDSSTPHLLIAGSTGGGKSVCENVIAASLLAYYSPDDVKLVMIDPKQVEFGLYRDLPHLIGGKVQTDVRAAAFALQDIEREMHRRYSILSKYQVSNIQEYRHVRAERLKAGDRTIEHLPSIVVFMDELAALMSQAKTLVEEEGLEKTPEETICQIAALGRAAGIHLILATQRPTVDVVTGNIKANIPTKLALLVAKPVDSRVVLDENGAEELQGRGDAIFQSPMHKSLRVQAAFITKDEVKALVEYWRTCQPLTGEEGVAPIDATHMHQQSFLDLPVVPSPAPMEQAEEQPAADDPLAAHLEAFLRGKQLPFVFSKLSNEQLYPFVEAWTSQRPTVTRDEIRIEFGVSQTRAGTILIWLHKRGIIGDTQRGGRPRQVLVFQQHDGAVLSETTLSLEETSV